MNELMSPDCQAWPLTMTAASRWFTWGLKDNQSLDLRASNLVMTLLHDLDDGRKRKISEHDYYHYFTAQPPVLGIFTWRRQVWDFGYAQDGGFVYGFRKERNGCYAQRTGIRTGRNIHPLCSHHPRDS